MGRRLEAALAALSGCDSPDPKFALACSRKQDIPFKRSTRRTLPRLARSRSHHHKARKNRWTQQQIL
jgi:hypothetical protein